MSEKENVKAQAMYEGATVAWEAVLGFINAGVSMETLRAITENQLRGLKIMMKEGKIV